MQIKIQTAASHSRCACEKWLPSRNLSQRKAWMFASLYLEQNYFIWRKLVFGGFHFSFSRLAKLHSTGKPCKFHKKYEASEIYWPLGFGVYITYPACGPPCLTNQCRSWWCSCPGCVLWLVQVAHLLPSPRPPGHRTTISIIPLTVLLVQHTHRRRISCSSQPSDRSLNT